MYRYKFLYTPTGSLKTNWNDNTTNAAADCANPIENG